MAIGTTAAIIGSSLIGAGASAMAGRSASKAANQATAASEQSAREQNALSKYIYEQQRADNEPFRQGGLTGQQEYMRMLGLDTQNYAAQSTNPLQMGYEQGTPVGGTNDFAGRAYLAANPDVAQDAYFAQNPLAHFQQYGQSEGRAWNPSAVASGAAQPSTLAGYTGQQVTDKLRATPGYEFAFGEGQRALDASATARGGLFSGAAAKALTKYGQGVADQQYGSHMNRLAALAGMGQTATNQNAQYAQNYGTQVGNTIGNLANARVSGINAKAQAKQSMWGDIAGFGGMALGQFGGFGKQPEYF
ncbi:hypothetical protein V3390_09170 [Luteimonas sp. FXH3W]|uniref:DNA transfer protein p32 n=1 Tax=Aquilutibacter rugosus TaxID=3115820 RepID=A0ABU7V117_9GAMM